MYRQTWPERCVRFYRAKQDKKLNVICTFANLRPLKSHVILWSVSYSVRVKPPRGNAVTDFFYAFSPLLLAICQNTRGKLQQSTTSHFHCQYIYARMLRNAFAHCLTVSGHQWIAVCFPGRAYSIRRLNSEKAYDFWRSSLLQS